MISPVTGSIISTVWVIALPFGQASPRSAVSLTVPVVERCFNRLEQWRGLAMRSDKLLRSYRAAVSLAATLIWIKSDLINTV